MYFVYCRRCELVKGAQASQTYCAFSKPTTSKKKLSNYFVADRIFLLEF